MEVITYALLALLCAGGLGVGYGIGKLAKEELRTAFPYLTFAREVLLALMAFFLAQLSFSTIVSASVASVFLASLILLNAHREPGWVHRMICRVKAFRNDYLLYVLLAADFFLSYRKLLFIMPSLIFLYGFPAGSLLYYQRGRIKQLVLPMALFVVVSLLLFVFF